MLEISDQNNSRVSRQSMALVPPLLAGTIGMFALASCYWAIDVYLLWEDVYELLPKQPSTGPVPVLYGILTQDSAALYAQRILSYITVYLLLYLPGNVCSHVLGSSLLVTA